MLSNTLLAMDPSFWAYFGAFLGVLGAGVGCWMAVRNSRPGPERMFMVKACIWSLIGAGLFVCAILFIPSPWKWTLALVYFPVLLWGILYCNRSLAELRARDA